MRAHELKCRVLGQHPVARGHLIFVRRQFRVQEHVVLGMLAKILLVIVHRHPGNRQPAIVRLALMSDEYPVALADEIEHLVELRVIDHDQAALRVAKLHADVLPHLDGDRAGGKRGIELCDRLLLPTGVVPAVHGE